MKTCPIHIAFCVNDAFVAYVLVTLKSILRNRVSDVCMTIHILTDYVSIRNGEKLKELISRYKNVEMNIHVVDDASLQNLEVKNFTIYAWYRILLPDILSQDIHRVLYLDADTIVEDDLSWLFQIDMDNNSIAAVIDDSAFYDSTYERCGYDKNKLYVCSGVLLMNLDYWRKYDLSKKILEWGEKNSTLVKYPDQDAINYVCQDTKIMLPLRYNIVVPYFRMKEFSQGGYASQLLDCIERPAIIHYCRNKPWLKDMPFHPMRQNWMKYNKLLGYPVKCHYTSKGWIKIKTIVWNMLHPSYRNSLVNIEDVKRRLLFNAMNDNFSNNERNNNVRIRN